MSDDNRILGVRVDVLDSFLAGMQRAEIGEEIPLDVDAAEYGRIVAEAEARGLTVQELLQRAAMIRHEQRKAAGLPPAGDEHGGVLLRLMVSALLANGEPVPRDLAAMIHECWEVDRRGHPDDGGPMPKEIEQTRYYRWILCLSGPVLRAMQELIYERWPHLGGTAK